MVVQYLVLDDYDVGNENGDEMYNDGEKTFEHIFCCCKFV